MKKSEKKTEKIEFCLDWIRKIHSNNAGYRQERIDAELARKADKSIVTFDDDTSEAATTDLLDAIEWVKPTLLDVFTSGNEVVSLVPTPGDEKTVSDMEALCNYQVQVKNQWFKIFHDWLDDALAFKMGVLKYQWTTQTKKIEREYNDLDDLEFQIKLQELNVEILEHSEIVLQEAVFDINGFMVSPAIKKHNIKIQYIFTDSFPLLEAIPVEDVGFPLDCADTIKAIPFFYHKTRLPKYEIIKKYGKKLFNEIEHTVKAYEDKDELTYLRFSDIGGIEFLYNEKSEEYIVYECFYFDPDTGEPYVLTLAGDTILSEESNMYGKPPFEILNVLRRAHSVLGYSFYDLLKEIQRIRTAMLREFLNHVYFGNKKRAYIDMTKINIEDWKDNRPGVAIRTLGDPRTAVMEEQKAQLPSEFFSIWEMLNTEKDYHSGVPRSFQGVSSKVLNKTWRGQAQQVSQASQRVAMIARIIAETAVAPLVEDIIMLNLKFLDKKTSVRYLGKWLEVQPDNLLGKYDMIINVGVGADKKEVVVGQMQQLLALYSQLAESGVGIVSPHNVYNAMAELIKAMGFKNIGDFITMPQPQYKGMPTPQQGGNGGGMNPKESLAGMIGGMVPRQPMNPIMPAMGEQ